MQLEVWYFILLPIFILNVVVSVYLFKIDDLEPFQRGAQILIIWLIPLFAAIGIWMFHKNNEPQPINMKSFGGGPGSGGGDVGGD